MYRMPRRLNWKGWALICAVSFVVFSIGLLVTGARVLVWEAKVDPGQTYIAGEWGDLGKAQSPSLVCRYFTGRSIKMTAFWYSPNNIMGRDSCPFLVRE